MPIHRHIDKLLAKAARKILRLPHEYPTDLIYLPTKYKGLGMRKFSTTPRLKNGILFNEPSHSENSPRVRPLFYNATSTPPPQDVDMYITSLGYNGGN